MFADINHFNVNRVKSLSKSGNPRKDQAPNPVPQSSKEALSTSSFPASAGAEEFNDQRQEVKTVDMGRKVVEKENSLYSSAPDVDKQPSSFSSSSLFNGREEKGLASASMDRERFEVKNSYTDSTSQKMNPYSQNDVNEKVQKVSPPRRERFQVKNSYSDSTSQSMNSYSQNDTNEKVQKVSPPRRKGSKDEKPERSANWLKRDANGSDHFTTSSKQQSTANYNAVTTASRQSETESSPDGNISAILEVCQTYGTTIFTSFQLHVKLAYAICFFLYLLQEEEALLAAHRKEIEDTMEIVREVSYCMCFFCLILTL